MDMTTTRWLCVPAGPYSVNLVPVGEEAVGPDVFVKADELNRLRAERDALREALAGAVNVLDLLRTYADAKYDYASSRAGTLVHVASTIDAAKALLTPNAGAKAQPADTNG